MDEWRFRAEVIGQGRRSPKPITRGSSARSARLPRRTSTTSDDALCRIDGVGNYGFLGLDLGRFVHTAEDTQPSDYLERPHQRDTILAFLQYIEGGRGNSARTRLSFLARSRVICIN